MLDGCRRWVGLTITETANIFTWRIWLLVTGGTLAFLQPLIYGTTETVNGVERPGGGAPAFICCLVFLVFGQALFLRFPGVFLLEKITIRSDRSFEFTNWIGVKKSLCRRTLPILRWTDLETVTIEGF